MNILYYLDAYPKLSESFVLNEIVELTDRGHNVAVFALTNPNEDISHREANELCIETAYADTPTYTNLFDIFDSRLRDFGFRKFVERETRPKHAAHHLHLAVQCLDFVESLPYTVDVIHGHFATHMKLGARYAANYLNVPFTVTAHAYEIFPFDQRETAKRVLDAADRVVVPSKYNREFLIETLGIDNEFDVVYATTAVDNFIPENKERPQRIVSIARLVEKKGYEYALRAVSKVAENYPNTEYHVIGKGPLENELKGLAGQLGISDHVEFLGHVTDGRLHRELDEAAVFVLPCVIADDGDRDVIPVALKEAMAMETACVSTRLSGIPEMINDGENGILIPECDTDRLSEAIRDLFDSPAKRHQLGVAGRRTVTQEFDIRSAVDDLTTTFDKAQNQ